MSSASSSPLSSVLSSVDDDIADLSPLDELSPAQAATPFGVDETESPEPVAKRSPSPVHETVLADNPDIAFIAMFRSRFNDVFPTKLQHFGPQDIEKGVVDPMPSPQVENLLCALLGLVLNRKKHVERGHHGRALEEALAANKGQWPRSWQGTNPISGGRNFISMTPAERLDLMKTLVMWALSSSDAVQTKIKDSYKQARHDDDLNQPLSVQPWGRDGEKRRYWLIEGQDDTAFRLYRETNPYLKKHAWRSMAGDIDELRVQAEKLNGEESQFARKLGQRILTAIPRFEATEDKRKRREYRQMRKAQFSRPEPGFSLYEGRTRGKRMRYTYDDDEDEEEEEEEGFSDDFGLRRSTRQSGISTPGEPQGPTVTASGRQVKSRQHGMYGASKLSRLARDADGGAEADESELSEIHHNDAGVEDEGRPARGRRSSQVNGWTRDRNHIEGYNSVDEMGDEEDATSSGGWDGGDDDNADDNVYADEVDDELSEDEDDEDEDMELKSLIVKLPYRPESAKVKEDIPRRPSTVQLGSPVRDLPPAIPPQPTPNGMGYVVSKQEQRENVFFKPEIKPETTESAPIQNATTTVSKDNDKMVATSVPRPQIQAPSPAFASVTNGFGYSGSAMEDVKPSIVAPVEPPISNGHQPGGLGGYVNGQSSWPAKPLTEPSVYRVEADPAPPAPSSATVLSSGSGVDGDGMHE